MGHLDSYGLTIHEDLLPPLHVQFFGQWVGLGKKMDMCPEAIEVDGGDGVLPTKEGRSFVEAVMVGWWCGLRVRHNEFSSGHNPWVD